MSTRMTVEVHAVAALPADVRFLLLVLTALGVLAHAAFI